MNTTLLSHLLTRPWAISRAHLERFLRVAIAGDAPRRLGAGALTPAIEHAARFSPRSDTSWDTYYWADEEQRVVRGKFPTKPGYTVLNWEGLDANFRGTLPDVPPGTHVLLVWGPLGRAWGANERYWCDGIEVDEIVASIAARPPGERIVLWFRSPGGFCTGIAETAAEIRRLAAQYEIIAFTDDLCASAAYWLASQCASIAATPSAELGSIGVYLAFYDYAGQLAEMGVKLELFKVGTLKAIGVLGNPLDAAARAYLQAGVDEAYAAFTAAVLSMRTLAEETMQGQTLAGPAALAANLVDAAQYPSAAAFFAMPAV